MSPVDTSKASTRCETALAATGASDDVLCRLVCRAGNLAFSAGRYDVAAVHYASSLSNESGSWAPTRHPASSVNVIDGWKIELRYRPGGTAPTGGSSGTAPATLDIVVLGASV